MRLAPVVLFVYNRPQHTVKTLEALSVNELAADSRLIIYADGPKPGATPDDLEKIRLTREIIRSKQWAGTVEINEAKINKGLAKSVIEGVTETVNKYARVIVLEDDLIAAKGFLKYMNAALEKYEIEERVMQVSGYFFPVKVKTPTKSSFFLPFTTSWGWATWKRSWDVYDAQASGYQQLKSDRDLSFRFNLDGSYPYADMLIRQMENTGIDSWAIRWWWSVFKKSGLILYPGKSLIYNHGYGKGATHTSGKGKSWNIMSFDKDIGIEIFPDIVLTNNENFLVIRRFLAGSFAERPGSFFKRFVYSGAKSIISLIKRNPI